MITYGSGTSPLVHFHRPTGKNFYAVAEGRRLEISPWAYEYRRREMCMVMNELVRMIARRADDWWKD